MANEKRKPFKTKVKKKGRSQILPGQAAKVKREREASEAEMERKKKEEQEKLALNAIKNPPAPPFLNPEQFYKMILSRPQSEKEEKQNESLLKEGISSSAIPIGMKGQQLLH